MNRTMVAGCVLIILIAPAGCGNRRWSDQQRADFKTKCLATETIGRLTVQFRGFEDAEFSAVTVKEYNGAAPVDTFTVTVPPAQTSWDKENKVRSATLERTMKLTRTYEFIVPGQRPFRLADMKMVMWPQYTMNSEGWGCVMGDYSVDGVRFKENASPTFTKRR